MDHPIPKPIYTTVPAKGLKGDFKILHFTDLHACALGEEEKSAMPDYRRDYTYKNPTTVTSLLDKQ